MDPLKQYDIAFVGLKTGLHRFQFEIDDRFFEMFSGSIVKKAKVQVALKFKKEESFFMLEFHLEGSVHLPCDRCGSELDYPVDHEYSIVVKFDEHYEEDKDDSNADVIYISRSDSHLNVAQLIYEFISLSIPINHVTCDNLTGPKPCNLDVLTKLENQSQVKPKADHRWDDLSKIKFN